MSSVLSLRAPVLHPAAVSDRNSHEALLLLLFFCFFPADSLQHELAAAVDLFFADILKCQFPGVKGRRDR